MLKDNFGFAEHQEKTTYGLGYRLTLTRNKDDAIIDKAACLADARIKNGHIHWYIPQYTPSNQQKGVLSKQKSSKTSTEIRYIERSVFMKEVNIQNLLKFEWGKRESMNVPLWIIIGFQQRDIQDSQNLNNDSFFKITCY